MRILYIVPRNVIPLKHVEMETATGILHTEGWVNCSYSVCRGKN